MADRICVVVVHKSPHTPTCVDSLHQILYPKCTKFVVGTIPRVYPSTLICPGTSPNVGIEWALSKPFPWILLVSNETIVDPHILTAFMAQVKATPDAKILGHFGGRWDLEKAACIPSTECESQIVDYVTADALLMHRSVPESIGLLEPRFRQSFADLDFCFRARRKGFVVRTAPHAKVWCPPKSAIPFLVAWQDKLLWYKRNLTHVERKHAIWAGIKQLIFPKRK